MEFNPDDIDSDLQEPNPAQMQTSTQSSVDDLECADEDLDC
jgi:hypothetical protein